MLLTLVIILLLIGCAVVGTIYSNFVVFYDTFSEIENYNKAYYASIAALERAELAIRWHHPGYEGTGGWDLSDGSSWGTGDKSDYPISSGFSYLDEDGDSAVLWNITSLTTRIPSTGNGNVSVLFSTGDSSNYNVMDYNIAETFLLEKDTLTGSAYGSGAISKKIERPGSSPASASIVGKIRLPLKLSTYLGKLDEEQSSISNSPNNDAVVSWQIKGDIEGVGFSIYSSQQARKRSNVGWLIDKDFDSAIRESDLNTGGGVTLNFGRFSSPFMRNRGIVSNTTIISSKEQDLSGKAFFAIMNNSNVKNVEIELSLLNSLNTENGLMYPFLEYYMDFGRMKVPDKYYTINAEGKVADYQVNIVVKKPTIENSVLGSFVMIQ